ncbi:MAG: Gfo/Idh/MocA family protein [Candidatus Zipacnadales bacterium]
MAKPLRVGFIGFGSIARDAHMPGWNKLKGDGIAELVAIADVSSAAREAAQTRFGLAPEMCFEDYEEMLAKVELDIVDVCTPNCLHKAPTIRAFEAGAHVIVEKPMTVSAADGEAMIAAGKKANKLLMVAQSCRYLPSARAAKRAVKAIGRIYWARASLLRPRGVPAWGAFTIKELSAGGPIYDLGVHILDWCLWMMEFPKPTGVSAALFLELSNKKSIMKHDPKKYTVPEELAMALIRFENDAVCTLETSWAVNAPEGTFSCLLSGTKGGLDWNWDSLTLVREEYGMLTNAKPQIIPEAGQASHAEEIYDFVDAIRKGRPSPVPGEQAIITQRILDAMYESAAKGREVVFA